MPKVKVNGIEVDVREGANMVEAAEAAGVEIPHYCYHPNLSVAGNCRMCVVDVEAGGRGPDIACNMKARDGLEIRTDTPRVAQMRKSTMEFLLKNHPLDCPICDQSGECRLQDYYMEHAGHASRLGDPKVSKAKRQDIGEHIVLDAERCVACSRCVRFGDEITGTGELRLFNRGDHTEIGIFPGDRLRHSYQGVLADICPVGALTAKNFRFKKRVWYLRETESICGGCATGCNVKICHQNGELFRVVPRRNDDVNQSWMCDPGRAAYADVAGLGRLLQDRVDGRSVGVDEALQRVAATLRLFPEARVGFVLGAQSSNEANWALLQLARTHLPTAPVYSCEGNDPAAFDLVDDLLITDDKNPNTAGVALMAIHDGNVGSRADLVAALAEGGLDLLVVLEDDVVGRVGPAEGVAIAYIGAGRNATSEWARYVLPAAASVAQDCTYTNGAGRVQRLRRAVHPVGDARPAWSLVEGLATSLGGSLGFERAAQAFSSLASAVPAFAGMSYSTVGLSGQVASTDAGI